MDIHLLKEILLWCAIINYALLLMWAGIFIFAHDWLFRWHKWWFTFSVETFDALHYAGMGIYKIAIWLFLLVPLIVLCFTT
ncbi:DUF6868 family protein [Glaciimonas soli]|uniref:DUF6868 family protein n=1 Tax=Glaciimonas soli TaxID=2590999 RepID=UPI001D1777FD|nr:hypothetical protein [Glaciimonas soli]